MKEWIITAQSTEEAGWIFKRLSSAQVSYVHHRFNQISVKAHEDIVARAIAEECPSATYERA